MASMMDNSTAMENNTGRRLPGLNPINPLRSSLAFGTGFGVGQSAWSTNGSIWHGANRFTDGASDEGNARDSRSHSKTDGDYTSGRTGSSSLLSSSESEFHSSRSNVPWKTTGSAKSPVTSLLQNQLISPTRHWTADNISNANGPTQSRGSRSFVLPGGTTFEMDELSTSHQTSRNAPTNSSFQPLKHDGFPEFLPSYANKTASEINGSGFNSNGKVGGKPRSQYLGGNVPRDMRSDMDANSFSKAPRGALNNDYHARSRAPSSYTNLRPSLMPLPNTFNSAQQPSHFQNLTSKDIADESFNRQEIQLSNAFNKIAVGNGSIQWADEAPHPVQYQSQRQPLEASIHGRDLVRSKFSLTADQRDSTPQENQISDSVQDFGYQYLSGNYRTPSLGEHGTTSPSTSEYRRGLHSPFYSTSGTPPTGPESMRSASGSGFSSRTSNGQAALLDRKLRVLDPYSQDLNFLQPNNLHNQHNHLQYPPPPYEYTPYGSTVRMNPLANPYTVSGYAPVAGPPIMSKYPSREPDPSQILRSPLLEDFRTNTKTNKRYELQDIYNHVVEFSGDQHGSRFIQQKLETANSDEKDQIFTEIQPNSIQLMTDVFGNYVIQKIFEHGNQSQKKVLANQMKGRVLSLSLQMYGCRVVQKALEHILTDQQASMVKELETHVMKLVKDQNGNHVIQKAIERVPAEHIRFIIDAFTDQVQRLATHPYGCRVIQRLLEHCEQPAKNSILRELHACVPMLIPDQFGNYVIQHMIENGELDDRYRVVSIVQTQLLVFSKHKFASNVVEKSIQFAEQSQRMEILDQLTAINERGESPVLGLLRDQYGNYVIQKVLAQLQGPKREALVNQIKSHLIQLKKFSYGKQILAIEKLVFDNTDHGSLSVSTQSSSLPSTNASSVEGGITPPQVPISKPGQSYELHIALPPASGLARS